MEIKLYPKPYISFVFTNSQGKVTSVYKMIHPELSFKVTKSPLNAANILAEFRANEQRIKNDCKQEFIKVLQEMYPNEQITFADKNISWDLPSEFKVWSGNNAIIVMSNVSISLESCEKYPYKCLSKSSIAINTKDPQDSSPIDPVKEPRFAFARIFRNTDDISAKTTLPTKVYSTLQWFVTEKITKSPFINMGILLGGLMEYNYANSSLINNINVDSCYFTLLQQNGTFQVFPGVTGDTGYFKNVPKLADFTADLPNDAFYRTAHRYRKNYYQVSARTYYYTINCKPGNYTSYLTVKVKGEKNEKKFMSNTSEKLFGEAYNDTKPKESKFVIIGN